MKNRWRCTVCGYVHLGDTPPDRCPVCGVSGDLFQLLLAEADGELKRVCPEVNGENKPSSNNSSPDIHQVLLKISYGLYIVSTQFQGRDNGQCANTCFQVTADPVRIAIGINKQNYTHELIEQSGLFGVSILNRQGQEYARKFGYQSGRLMDKFSGVGAHRGESGVLLLDEALATLEASVTGKLDAGTHTLFLADVRAVDILQEGEPMTYAYYQETK